MNATSPSMRERFMKFMSTPNLTQQTISRPRPSPIAPSMGGPIESCPSKKGSPNVKNGRSSKGGPIAKSGFVRKKKI
ncbi:hypothetical protein AHAS_Ahas20G0273300 [Arachis hypogaea]